MSAIPRNEGEAFEDYKERRAADHEATQRARAGKMFHESFYEGSYINKEKNTRKALKAQFGSFRQFKKATRAAGATRKGTK